MALEGSPARDLAGILLRQPSSGIISTVPLKPSAWIVRVYPALLDPDAKGNARAHAEVVQRTIRTMMSQLGAFKPIRWKFSFAVRHVLTTENAQPQHFRRRKLREKCGVEALSHGRRAGVAIALLHSIVNDYFDWLVHPPNLARHEMIATDQRTSISFRLTQVSFRGLHERMVPSGCRGRSRDFSFVGRLQPRNHARFNATDCPCFHAD